MHWQVEANGWVAHPVIPAPDGSASAAVPWYSLPLGRLTLWMWFTHRCTPWSIGVHGYFAEMQVTERCWCGGVREGRTIGMVHAWAGPQSSEPLAYEYDGGWRDRFSRYWGTAVFYRPTLRAVEEVQ